MTDQIDRTGRKTAVVLWRFFQSCYLFHLPVLHCPSSLVSSLLRNILCVRHWLSLRTKNFDARRRKVCRKLATIGCASATYKRCFAPLSTPPCWLSSACGVSGALLKLTHSPVLEFHYPVKYAKGDHTHSGALGCSRGGYLWRHTIPAYVSTHCAYAVMTRLSWPGWLMTHRGGRPSRH